MPQSKITVIILNWNGREDTIECLKSLKHITCPNYEILLTDNDYIDIGGVLQGAVSGH